MRKRISGVLAAVLAVVMTVSACGGPSAEDAENYVKAVLDASYKQEYSAYAQILGEDEAAVQEEMESDFLQQIDLELISIVDLSEEGKTDYIEAARNVLKLAKYEVTGGEKKEDGFAVQVKVEPADVYQTLTESSAAVATELMEADSGADLTQGDALAQLAAQSIQRSVENNTYGEAQTLEIAVTVEDNVYSIADEEMTKIQEALFPGSTQ